MEDDAGRICIHCGKEGGTGCLLGTLLGRQNQAGDVFIQHHSRCHQIGQDNSRDQIGHQGDPGFSDPVPAADPPVQCVCVGGGMCVWRGGV